MRGREGEGEGVKPLVWNFKILQNAHCFKVFIREGFKSCLVPILGFRANFSVRQNYNGNKKMKNIINNFFLKKYMKVNSYEGNNVVFES